MLFFSFFFEVTISLSFWSQHSSNVQHMSTSQHLCQNARFSTNPYLIFCFHKQQEWHRTRARNNHNRYTCNSAVHERRGLNALLVKTVEQTRECFVRLPESPTFRVCGSSIIISRFCLAGSSSENSSAIWNSMVNVKFTVASRETSAH